jgi:hypothetical protein
VATNATGTNWATPTISIAETNAPAAGGGTTNVMNIGTLTIY